MKDLLILALFIVMPVWWCEAATAKDKVRQYRRLLRKNGVRDTVKKPKLMDLLVARKII